MIWCLNLLKTAFLTLFQRQERIANKKRKRKQSEKKQETLYQAKVSELPSKKLINTKKTFNE